MGELIEPFREHTRQQLLATGAPVVMLVHDWSKLNDEGHPSKRDQSPNSLGNRTVSATEHGFWDFLQGISRPFGTILAQWLTMAWHNG